MRGFIYVLFIDEDRGLRIVTVKRLMTRERTGQRREKMYIKGKRIDILLGKKGKCSTGQRLDYVCMYSGHTFN